MFTIQADKQGLKYTIKNLPYEDIREIKNALMANWWYNKSGNTDRLLQKFIDLVAE